MGPDDRTQYCILSILQRGLTEARAMAEGGDTKAAAALLDALDNLPRHLASWGRNSETEIRIQLQCFANAYPAHQTDFVSLFDAKESLL